MFKIKNMRGGIHFNRTLGRYRYYWSFSDSNNNECSIGWVPNLAPTYIRRLPSDPADDNGNRSYLYRSDGSNYKVLSHYPHTDGCTLGDLKDTLYDPARTVTAWMVCSGEPACS